MNRLASLLMAILVLTSSPVTGVAETIVYPGDSIQAAVNNATSSGD
jgi:hypothetical protein